MSLSVRLRGIPFSSLVLLAAACGGSTANGTSPPTKDAGDDSTLCDGIALFLPPIVNVKNASDGSQICGATFQAVSDAGLPEGSNLAVGCSSLGEACPTSAPSGGSLSCVYALVNVGDEGTETVSVSAPGFASTTVEVKSGLETCNRSSPASTVTVSLSSSGRADASCGAVGIVPATVTVRDATTGALICDPVITLVTDAGSSPDAGSLGFPCASNDEGCPSSPPDGGPISCVFEVSFSGVFNSGAGQTIRIAAPGYESTTVTGVQTGADGCVSSPTAGTQVEVSLTPAPADAGPDGTGPGAAGPDATGPDAH
jgi:hypothetical protein